MVNAIFISWAIAGEIEECEHVKRKFVKAVDNSFAAALGVNDNVAAILVILVSVKLLLIIGTLLMKVTFSVLPAFCPLMLLSLSLKPLTLQVQLKDM